MLPVAPAKESTLIQSDLGVLSQDSVTRGKRRAEAEVHPQHTRKSLRISGRSCLEGAEEGIVKPLEALGRSVKGKSFREVTDAQEAIMASIKEANAKRGKTVSFSNIERRQSAAIWNEVETGPRTSRLVRTAPMEETRMRSERSKEDPPDSTRRESRKSRGSTRRKGNKRRKSGSGILAEEYCKDAVEALEAVAEEGDPEGG
jgi:hypothetical protein